MLDPGVGAGETRHRADHARVPVQFWRHAGTHGLLYEAGEVARFDEAVTGAARITEVSPYPAIAQAAQHRFLAIVRIHHPQPRILRLRHVVEEYAGEQARSRQHFDCCP